MAGSIASNSDGFFERLKNGRLPSALSTLTISDIGLTPEALMSIFESQITSRCLDMNARRLGTEKRGFYSIGSSGHEGNACIAHVFRVNDMAFLHYRSGAFYLERAKKVPGETPIWNMALSFVASSEDPISGGRHKVIGSKALYIPPQTSTIASHLPKALGTAFSISLARTQKKLDAVLPFDAVTICSFGDASANHSTAAGAINTAAHTSYRGLPLPLVFLCEDNGIGISVKTPDGWIEANYGGRPGLHYIKCDGRDPVDALRGAQEAELWARRNRKPVFLHMRTVRLMGHAGSDLESAYRNKHEISQEADQDPLLHTTRHIIDAEIMTIEEVCELYSQISKRVARVMDEACERPKLTTSKSVRSRLINARSSRRILSPGKKLPNAPDDSRAMSEPQHMSRLISLALADEMTANQAITCFGEDVALKGGVYGVTTKLQQKFGLGRVFDTVLDEQSILGTAIGLAHNGYLPIPEIQFLAYVHNAEDQIRGEAATLSFFSDGQYTNPMVIRVAGLAYQKGFGGHFHNDNSVSVFRDIPGIILACPSNGREAVLILREALRLAHDEQRVVVFLEPIALYGTKDLIESGDNKMAFTYNDIVDRISFGDVNTIGDGDDLTIVTYGNGTYLSQRAIEKLKEKGIRTKIIDLRWLSPLPVDSLLKNLGDCTNVLIVDECRKTGSVSEEIITAFSDRDLQLNVSRVTGDDTFIPLGPAANSVLVNEDDIANHALALLHRIGRTPKP